MACWAAEQNVWVEWSGWYPLDCYDYYSTCGAKRIYDTSFCRNVLNLMFFYYDRLWREVVVSLLLWIIFFFIFCKMSFRTNCLHNGILAFFSFLTAYWETRPRMGSLGQGLVPAGTFWRFLNILLRTFSFRLGLSEKVLIFRDKETESDNFSRQMNTFPSLTGDPK